MKTKPFLCFTALVSMLFLAACGGGGGGGGGAGNGGNDNPLPPPPEAASLAELAGGAAVVGKALALSEVVGGGLAQTGLSVSDPSNSVNGFFYDASVPEIGYTYAQGTAGIQISGDSVIIHTPQGSRTFHADDFTVFNNGLAGIILNEGSQMLTEAETGIAGTSVMARFTEAAILGGKSVDLQYANFGVWETRISGQGPVGNTAIDTTLSFYEPFILEGNNAHKVAPPNSGVFTGTVLANVYERSDYAAHNKAVSLAGQTTLTLTSATAATIGFDFANFYTLNADLNIDGNGLISSSSNLSLSNHEKNTTGINLLDMGSGGVSGQFYGGIGDISASEAVGKFNYSAGRTEVRGAFGVRK